MMNNFTDMLAEMPLLRAASHLTADQVKRFDSYEFMETELDQLIKDLAEQFATTVVRDMVIPANALDRTVYKADNGETMTKIYFDVHVCSIHHMTRLSTAALALSQQLHLATGADVGRPQ